MEGNSELKVECREKLLQKLDELLGSDFLPSSVFSYGINTVGKTYTVKKFLDHHEFKSIYVNCIECSTGRQLFENIIYSLTYNEQRIEGAHDFMYEIQSTEETKLVIVLDNAERLRDMEANILQVFLQLQQFSSLNVCVLMISQLPFEKFHSKDSSEQPIVVQVPNYTKEEVNQILLSSFEASSFKDLVDESKEIYEEYLNVFLSTFFKVCRDLKELKFMANKYFPQYYEPIVNGSIGRHESQKLWRNISNPLKEGMSQIYLRFVNMESNLKLMPKNYDLPYYAKYLLIAGFLASYNDAKEDKRLFMKHHVKKRKRAQDANKINVAEKSRLVLGPKAFTVDRLLAIFYAIMDEKVPMTCNLSAQISTLCKLRLFKVASGESNMLDGGMRIECGVGLDFIVPLSRVLDFDIKPYLATFT